MEQHYIYIGSMTSPSFFFTTNELVSVNTDTALDLIGSELSIDTLTFQVYYDDTDGTLEGLSYATPMWYYRGSSFVGKFYFKTVERYGTKHFKIDAVSLIGLLEYEPHYGGMYQGMNAKDAIKEAILSNGLGLYRFSKYGMPRTSTAGTTSVALGANYKGTGITDSSTQSSFEVFFMANGNAEYGVEKVVWLSSINGYGSMGGKYVLGVTVTKTSSSQSSTDITVKVYCQYNGNGSPQATFSAKYTDFIDVKIFPASGYLNYSVGGGTTHQVSFTAISNNYEVPLYSSLGVSVLNDVITPQTTTFDFSLLYLYIAGSSGTPLYLDTIALKDTFSNDVYLRNAQTYYTAIATGYSVGGNKIAYNAYDSAYKSSSSNIQTDIPELNDAVENIEWADGIENMTVSGWVDVGTKREVLHQILFALNLNLYKSESGNLIINQLPSEVQDTFTADEIYDKGSVEAVKAPQSVELTEHAYTASGETETVFDNTDATVAAGAYVVTYDNAPIYGAPTPTGLTVLSYNANAAVVSGKGSLTAQTYLHSQRTLRSIVSDRPDGSTVSVSDATLVTFLNADNVMGKLLAYYGGSAKKVKNALIASGLCGKKYTFAHPFGGDATGYLAEANSVGSSTTKMNCTFITGFTPVSIGNEYENYVILTGSGTFAVPAGVTKMHVVLIGGGTGGDSGYAGEDGGANTNFVSASVADGGNYGDNGDGGKVYEVDINSPSASYAYACGTGGQGGAVCHDHNNNNAGSAGTASTFGSYSSASGTSSPYTNIMNGDVFAAQMPKWNANSGKGGDGGYKTINDSSNPTQVTQYHGENAYNFLTGETKTAGRDVLGAKVGSVYVWLGGSGGGAALNANGKDGGDYVYISGQQVINAIGGDGANATYTPPKATTYNAKYYGYGGMGGAGGGGGGCAGYDGQESQSFAGGSGGYGGKGGDGGDGCVIVFY